MKGWPEMERIVKNRSGSWDVYAGDAGEHVATTGTKAKAREALDDWHYFNPQERRDQINAVVRSVISLLAEAYGEGEIEQALAYVASRYENGMPGGFPTVSLKERRAT